jgi:hypothetical protein
MEKKRSLQEMQDHKRPSTYIEDGKEYPFWWSKETTEMTRLLSHNASQVQGVQTRCKTWTLRKEHKIEGGKSFDIRQKNSISTPKQAKHFSKRSTEGKLLEIMKKNKKRGGRDKRKHCSFAEMSKDQSDGHRGTKGIISKMEYCLLLVLQSSFADLSRKSRKI